MEACLLHVVQANGQDELTNTMARGDRQTDKVRTSVPCGSTEAMMIACGTNAGHGTAAVERVRSVR